MPPIHHQHLPDRSESFACLLVRALYGIFFLSIWTRFPPLNNTFTLNSRVYARFSFFAMSINAALLIFLCSNTNISHHPIRDQMTSGDDDDDVVLLANGNDVIFSILNSVSMRWLFFFVGMTLKLNRCRLYAFALSTQNQRYAITFVDVAFCCCYLNGEY